MRIKNGSRKNACADVTRYISCDATNVELVALKAVDDAGYGLTRTMGTGGFKVK